MSQVDEDLPAWAFRRTETILQPDRRGEHFVRMNASATEATSISLQDRHADIAPLELGPPVPEKVIRLFDIARNLFLYSWFVYDFGMVGMMQAHAAVEMALRERMEQEGISAGKTVALRARLEIAKREGWLTDAGFPHIVEMRRWRRQQEDGYKAMGIDTELPPDEPVSAYVDKLVESLPSLRNALAHGSAMLVPPGQALITLDVSHKIIQQLFPLQEAAPAVDTVEPGEGMSA